jgi:hypothetical protein
VPKIREIFRIVAVGTFLIYVGDFKQLCNRFSSNLKHKASPSMILRKKSCILRVLACEAPQASHREKTFSK